MASRKVETLLKDKPLQYDVINLKSVPAAEAAGLYKVGPGQFKLYRKSEEPSITPCVSIDYNRNRTTTGYLTIFFTVIIKGSLSWERMHIKMFGNCEPKEEYWGAGFLELIKNWKTVKNSLHNLRLALDGKYHPTKRFIRFCHR